MIPAGVILTGRYETFYHKRLLFRITVKNINVSLRKNKKYITNRQNFKKISCIFILLTLK